MKSSKALFLDRDGTINVDHAYIDHPEKIELIPGAAELIASAIARGYQVVVVTNQSGIGRGLIQADDLPKIHRRLDFLLAQSGARISRYQICPHHPQAGCDCRKPSAKLILEAASALSLDIANAWMVGDAWSDIGAGKNAGCKTALVRTGKGRATESALLHAKNPAELPDLVIDHLGDLLPYLV